MKPRGINGAWTNPRLRTLGPALEEWISLNAKLGREWQGVGDAPWWYNERALLSVFAGAVWRSGGSAFEEYSELKRGEVQMTSGRVDLWFSTGRHDFWAEAKACEIPFTRNGHQVLGIVRHLERAKSDVRRCKPDGLHRRLAILFGQPYLRPCPRREMKERIAWLIEQAQRVDHDALAWVFPEQRKLPTIRNWVSPGSIIWIKEVRR
jgi:hypothetical protein